MIVRKTLLLIISLVFVASMLQAKVVISGKDTLYLIPKTAVAPTSYADSVWKDLDWNFQRLYAVDGKTTPEGGYQTVFGMHKAMYDADNLYILFYTQTDNIVDLPAKENWNQDAVEIYIDADNSKINPKNADDIQITIPHFLKDDEANRLKYIGWPQTLDSTGIEFKITDEDNTVGLGGWYVFVKIPLANISLEPIAGTKIGWEMQQDKSTDGTARTNMTKWWNATNASWNNSQIWGTAMLTDRVIDPTKGYEINKVATAPVIDGKPDAVYGGANSITMNYFRVESTTDPVDVAQAFLTSTVVYDSDNIYALFDVADGEIVDLPAKENWNQDAVEFYIDADNSKISPKNADDIQVTMPHFTKDDEANRLKYIGWPQTIDSTGVEYKISDKEDGTGWYCEMKIPLSNISLEAIQGTVIGLEFQKDDAKATDAARTSMEKWWSASNASWNNSQIWGTAVIGGDANANYIAMPDVINPLVGVTERPASEVKSFALSQNYPNPFNPTTTIRFSIPQSGFTSVKVYNMLGQEVATLLNRDMKAGSFEVNFDASRLTSGVYFYKLQSGNTSLTKKMLLLK